MEIGTLTVRVVVKLSLWSAIKLRIAGAHSKEGGKKEYKMNSCMTCQHWGRFRDHSGTGQCANCTEAAMFTNADDVCNDYEDKKNKCRRKVI